MPQSVSDEDVAAEVQAVERLRQQLADSEAKRLDNERSQSNSIQMAQLKAERAQLELQLSRSRNASTATAAREGVSAPLDAARVNMEAAVAAQKEEEKLAKADKVSTPASATTTGEGS